MNKTIINGIDVSECNIRFNQFEKNICELGNRKLGELHYLCSENPNCYFKQLKRLQKENEELKKKIESYNCNANCYKYKETDKYKQALEEIREMLKIAERAKSANKHFEYMDNASNKCNEVLNVENN